MKVRALWRQPQIRAALGAVLGLSLVAATVWAAWAGARWSTRLETLDRQLLQLQHLAAQAEQLRGMAPARTPDAAATLQSAVAQHLGGQASVSIQGGQAVLVLQALPASRLVAGLERVRQTARIRYSGAQLSVQNATVSGKLHLQLPEGS